MAEKKITLNMITCRTIQQGVGMEAGKTSQKYFDACTIMHMHPDDMKKLGVWKNTNVRVTSSVGSVIVKAVEATQGPHPGLGFIPMGPWANSVISDNTYSTGMPTFKGVPVTVEVAINEPILLGIELVQKQCGVKVG